MTSEEILMRREIRQMLNEIGINKNTLKDMVKEVLHEEVEKACKQAIAEYNMTNTIDSLNERAMNRIVKESIQENVAARVRSVFDRMRISIDITDDHGTSSITRP